MLAFRHQVTVNLVTARAILIGSPVHTRISSSCGDHLLSVVPATAAARPYWLINNTLKFTGERQTQAVAKVGRRRGLLSRAFRMIWYVHALPTVPTLISNELIFSFAALPRPSD
jgi:hypothetical protein